MYVYECVRICSVCVCECACMYMSVSVGVSAYVCL